MTTASPLVTHSVRQIRRWSTPGVLWRGLWAIWALDVVVLVCLLYTGKVHENGLQAVGRDAGPSIIAAQQIKTSVADMDAVAVHELLTDPASETGMIQTYNQRREEAARALVTAARNITYGDAELRPILTIQLALSRYEALVQQARDLRNDGKPFMPSYRSAATIMDRTILPAADALTKANLDMLEVGYADERTQSLNARFLVGAAVVALLGLLLAIQIYLFRHTNRVFNLPLLTATALVFAFVIYTLNDLHTAGQDLRHAKEDAFTSVNALWRARAVAYSASADESRFLLDPASATESTREFMDHRDSIATLPAGLTFQSAARSSAPIAATGYLVDQSSNITSADEQQASHETLRAFARYVVIDQEIRDLQAKGRTREAVALCVGRSLGQSAWALTRFDTALDQTLKINQEAFDSAVRSGYARLENFDMKASVIAALTAVLCLLGLMQRIREYN